MAKVLIEGDGLTEEEALEVENEARDAVIEAIQSWEDLEEVFTDLAGLEPDYILELIHW